MVDRRHVLKLGAISFVGALFSGKGIATAATRRSPLLRGVFDERFADCRAFGDELHAIGVSTTVIRGEVAKLWYEDLRDWLRKERAPVAGLTDRSALFCLEELARDVGMKVAIRVDHAIDENDCVRHEAFGPPALIAATRMLEQHTGFGRTMAGLAVQHATSGRWHPAAQRRTGPWAPAGQVALVTWVVA